MSKVFSVNIHSHKCNCTYILQFMISLSLQRRLLAVYLHHDGSILTNVFCTQLLGFESVLQCLNNHFVVWGWDLTYESNKLKWVLYFLSCVHVTVFWMKCHNMVWPTLLLYGCRNCMCTVRWYWTKLQLCSYKTATIHSCVKITLQWDISLLTLFLSIVNKHCWSVTFHSSY